MLETLSTQEHTHPQKGPIRIGLGTIEEWYYLYRKDGLPGLRPQARKDRGRSRGIDDPTAEAIQRLIEEHPDLDGPGVLAELRALSLPVPSLSTYYRFVKARGLDALKRAPRADHRAYAFELPGDCWECDVMYGPHLPGVDGRRRKTYLFAILDDATRLIAHAQFYYDQHLRALKDCLKQALLKRGLPKRFYVDNARIFRSRGIVVAAAQLGFHVVHSRPYKPQGRAKVERFFGTVRGSFVARLQLERVEDLDALNRLLCAWIENEYHQRPHSGLDGHTPWSRWVEQAEAVRVLPPEADLDWIFLEQAFRRVAKDGTLAVKSIRFEAGVRFIGQKVQIRFDPYDLRKIWLIDGEDGRHVLRPVDLYANRHAARFTPAPAKPECPETPLRALEQNAEALERRRPKPPKEGEIR
jgi:transposase InsO family protein